MRLQCDSTAFVNYSLGYVVASLRSNGASESDSRDGVKMIFSRGTVIIDSDYHWVLTVPAIWEDAAKQFMREAAEKVGSFLFSRTNVVCLLCLYFSTSHC